MGACYLLQVATKRQKEKETMNRMEWIAEVVGTVALAHDSLASRDDATEHETKLSVLAEVGVLEGHITSEGVLRPGFVLGLREEEKEKFPLKIVAASGDPLLDRDQESGAAKANELKKLPREQNPNLWNAAFAAAFAQEVRSFRTAIDGNEEEKRAKLGELVLALKYQCDFAADLAVKCAELPG